MTEDPLGLYWVGHSEVPSGFSETCVPITSGVPLQFPSPLPLWCADFLPLPCYLFIGSYVPPAIPSLPVQGYAMAPSFPSTLLHRERLDVSLRSSPPGHGVPAVEDLIG